MPSYRIGQAAELLDVSADTVRRWVDSGQLAARRTEGGRRQIDGRALARFAAKSAGRPEADVAGGRSARNRFAGIITKVVKDKVSAQVELQCGSHRLVSLMTREAADELGLAPGMLAVASVKATAVVVETPAG